jgi:hypothetical protein
MSLEHELHFLQRLGKYSLPSRKAILQNSSSSYETTHADGTPVLVVRDTKDRPKTWKRAEWGFVDPSVANRSVQSRLDRPIHYWTTWDEISYDSPYLSRNAINPLVGIAYLYILE